ncbi:hypothetical protein B9Z55_013353 [Caenorhabditis nigoni]|uniref:Uncharacterized protein n=1 Tax=Caenorhabditis nigoni TaxID=1611254 RepID=A0A2G5U1B2_9PELO|nr:hypothetical protein B9Z55_013353 [Caenorhabditis nigoni]
MFQELLGLDNDKDLQDLGLWVSELERTNPSSCSDSESAYSRKDGMVQFSGLQRFRFSECEVKGSSWLRGFGDFNDDGWTTSQDFRLWDFGVRGAPWTGRFNMLTGRHGQHFVILKLENFREQSTLGTTSIVLRICRVGGHGVQEDVNVVWMSELSLNSILFFMIFFVFDFFERAYSQSLAGGWFSRVSSVQQVRDFMDNMDLQDLKI